MLSCPREIVELSSQEHPGENQQEHSPQQAHNACKDTGETLAGQDLRLLDLDAFDQRCPRTLQPLQQPARPAHDKPYNQQIQQQRNDGVYRCSKQKFRAVLVPGLEDGLADLVGVVLCQQRASNMHVLGIVLADESQHIVAQPDFTSVIGLINGDGREVGVWCVDQLFKAV